MVRSIEITSGFATRLPGLGERKFCFGDDITIVWGQNASGKSSLLKIVAAHCGVYNGGWTRIHEPAKIKFLHETLSLPEGYSMLAPGKCQADIRWDGSPTLFFNTEGVRSSYSSMIGDPSDSMDGITTFDDQLEQIFSKPSGGQHVISKLNKILQMAGNPIDTDVDHPKYWNSTWAENWDIQRKFLKDLPKDGPSTILMDEPDMGLSIPNEFLLWTKVIPRLRDEGFQLIISTHSHMISRVGLEFDVIDLTMGYWEQCSSIIDGLSHSTARSVSPPDPSMYEKICRENEEEMKRKMKETEKKRIEEERRREESQRAFERMREESERLRQEPEGDS